jgi:hypothetical protein
LAAGAPLWNGDAVGGLPPVDDADRVVLVADVDDFDVPIDALSVLLTVSTSSFVMYVAVVGFVFPL